MHMRRCTRSRRKHAAVHSPSPSHPQQHALLQQHRSPQRHQLAGPQQLNQHLQVKLPRGRAQRERQARRRRHQQLLAPQAQAQLRAQATWARRLRHVCWRCAVQRRKVLAGFQRRQRQRVRTVLPPGGGCFTLSSAATSSGSGTALPLWKAMWCSSRSTCSSKTAAQPCAHEAATHACTCTRHSSALCTHLLRGCQVGCVRQQHGRLERTCTQQRLVSRDQLRWRRIEEGDAAGNHLAAIAICTQQQ